MKKICATVLTVGMLMLASVSAFAAEPAAGTYTCPNGYEACATNGTCLNNGVCGTYTCPNGYEACTTNGACLNNGVCGTRSTRTTNGGHHGGGHGNGRGHCGR